MGNKVKPIPDGYHGATPYLVVNGAAAAIEFYKKAFGAAELMRLNGPGEKIGHAEVKIGEAIIMLADEYPDWGFLGPKSLGGTPVSIMIYVEDVDKVFDQAVAAGAKAVKPVKDEFYGDRTGRLEDPFGHAWHISTHKEDVSLEEMQKRHEVFMKQLG